MNKYLFLALLGFSSAQQILSEPGDSLDIDPHSIHHGDSISEIEKAVEDKNEKRRAWFGRGGKGRKGPEDRKAMMDKVRKAGVKAGGRNLQEKKSPLAHILEQA